MEMLEFSFNPTLVLLKSALINASEAAAVLFQSYTSSIKIEERYGLKGEYI